MAVKKPIYRYQYKPTAATYFKPALGEKEQLAKSVGTQVTNLEQRFKNVGIPSETGAKEADQRNIIEKALNLKANQNMLMDVLEVLNRPTQAVTNILSSLGDQDKRDALTAAWEGLSGQKEIGARQALANLTGDKNILKIKEDNNTKIDDIGQFVIDLGLEIAADPTTWISMGVGAVKKAGQEATEKAIQKLTKKAIRVKDITKKAELLKQVEALKVPKPTFAQNVLSATDSKIRELTRKAIRNLKPEQAKVAIRGLRALKNIGERAGGLVNSLKDVKTALRGELDKVFGTANYQLDLLKAGVKGLDDQIETIVNRYAATLDEAGKRTVRNAVEEIYELGYKFDPNTGKILLDPDNIPKGTINAVDVADDLGDSKRNYQYTSRRISSQGGNLARAEQRVERFVRAANRRVGGKALTYTVKTADNGFSYISIRLNLKDASEALTDAAKKADIQQLVGKYRDYIRKSQATIELGKIPLSKEAKLIIGDADLGKAYRAYEDVIDRANELITATTAKGGVAYKAADIYDASSIGDVRYVRRVRTADYLKQLSDSGKFEPNPMLREIVSGTGKELNERLYRGTAAEYNDVLKMFYSAKSDRFAQDLVESAIDYIKVAESRFSMSEVTRLIFGLTPSKGYAFTKDAGGDLVQNLPTQIKEDALKQGFKETDKLKYTDKVKFSGGADWAQDSQFIRPVDELLDEANPLIMKKGKPVALNTKSSPVVTQEMATDFQRRFPNHKILDNGFVQVKIDEVNGVKKYTATGGEFKSLFESLPEELKASVYEYLYKGNMTGQKVALHRSAYEILKNAQNAYKVNINAGVKFFDEFLNFWKGVTLLSPSFHARNFLGNWTNMSLAGMSPSEIVKYTSEAWTDIVKRDEILKKISAGTATLEDKLFLRQSNTYVAGLASSRRGVRDLENLAELRKYSPDLKRKFGSGLKGKYNELVQNNFKLAERADEVQRLAMFKSLKKKGLSDAAAIQKVREVLFDYGKLTGFEKDYMKRFFPFYTFMKENMQFQMKNMLQNSGRYKNLFRGYKHYLEEVADLDEKDIPKYMTGNMWVPLPFVINKDDKEAISMLKLNLPASDFLEFVENPLKKAASSVAVPIKAAWEFMTGTDTFTGAPIQQFPGQKSLDKESNSLFKFLRNEKGEFDVMKDPILKKFSDDLGLRTLRRPLTAIMDSIDTILGRQDPATGLLDLLEQTGISTTVKKEDLNLTALYQQLEYLRNLKKLYEQNTGRELPTQAQSAGYKFKPK
jgi:hypothetical protein